MGNLAFLTPPGKAKPCALPFPLPASAVRLSPSPISRPFDILNLDSGSVQQEGWNLGNTMRCLVLLPSFLQVPLDRKVVGVGWRAVTHQPVLCKRTWAGLGCTRAQLTGVPMA